MNRMHAVAAAQLLAAIWLSSLLVGLLVPSGLFLADMIGMERLFDAWKQVSTLFAPYVGLVVAYVFGKRRAAKKSAKRPVPSLELLTGLIASVVWVAVILGPLAMAAVAPARMPIEDALEIAGQFAEVTGMVVAPALGYFMSGGSTPSTAG